MEGKKVFRSLSLIILSLIFLNNFLNQVAANLDYDSGWICMDSGLIPETYLSDYVKEIKGEKAGYIEEKSENCDGNYFIDDKEGLIKIKTPYLPEEGDYNFSFTYETGSIKWDGSIQKDENFTVMCGTKVYSFGDEYNCPPPEGCEEFREKSIICDFNTGENYVIFNSTGIDSVHFEEFRISKIREEIECEENYSENYCYGGDVYREFHTFFEKNGECIENITRIFIEDCGESYCESWSENYCKEGNVYRKRVCYERGCEEGGCFRNNLTEEELVEECESGCEEGECIEEEEKEGCIENWYCTKWSECQKGVQVRICEDMNKCYTARFKPEEEKPCSSINLKSSGRDIMRKDLEGKTIKVGEINSENFKTRNNFLLILLVIGVVLVIFLIILIIISS